MNKSIKALLPLLCVGLLASCANNSGSSSSNPAGTDSTETTTPGGDDTNTGGGENDDYVPYFGEAGEHEPVTINLWTTAGDDMQAILKNYVKAFEEVEPNIVVNNQKVSGDYDTLKSNILTGFASGDYPDIAYAYPDHVAEYIYNLKQVDLTDYINDPVYGLTDIDDFVPAFIEEGQRYAYEGTYSLPFSKSTEAMFYNPILETLDLSEVDSTINGNGILTREYLQNLTWEELFNRLCPALVAYNETLPEGSKIWDDSGQYSAIVGYDSDDNLFITLAEQYGCAYTSIDETTHRGSIDFNNVGMKSIMKMFNEAAQKKYFITKGSAGGEYVNTYFTQNQILFSIGSTGGMSHQYSATAGFTPTVARVPQAEDGKLALMSQGPSMTILKHEGADSADRIMAAWLFYRFMVNPSNSTAWAVNSTGYMPIRYSTYTTAEYQEICSETGKKGVDVLYARGQTYCADPDVTDCMFTSPVFVGSSTARQSVGGLVTQVINAGSSLTDERLDELFADAENTAKLAIH